MTRLPPEDRNLLSRSLVLLLLALVAGQGLLLWGSGRDTPLLVRLARIGELPTPAPSPSELGLAQLVEGLARLDGRPDLLLDRAQARRLVPVLPLFQQALASAGPEPASPTVDHFGSRLREYLGRTLRPSQVAHLQGLAARGELASTPAAAVERLPLLDKALRQRAGLPMEQADSVQSPVRRSLERVRVRDLVLGLLLIDEDSALQVTPKQASLLVPMQALLAEVLQRRPGEVGKSSAPLVEAQVRALLTEAQQQKILEVAEARGLAGLDVDQDDMLRQLGTLLVARQTGGSFRFDLQSLASGRPSEMAREGPAVIPQKAELDLQVAIRGILLHLEQQPALRLDSEQVADLALMTPSLQQCLVNLLNRTRDPRIPELQGRVAHLLRPEQVRYIRDHQHDPVAPLDFRPGEEPVAKELGRFIQARSQGLPYRPEVQGSNLPGAAVPFGSPTPGAPPTRPEPGSGGGPPAPVPTPAATRTMTPTPGARPEPVALQPSPGQPGPTPSPTGVEPPLEAMVRGMLFRMEKEPALRLRRSQVERLQERLADFRSVLDAMEAGRRDERGPELVRALEGFLSATQKEFLYAHAQDPPVALQVGRGESPLARELRRFVEARLAGRPYQPLWNLEAPK